MQTNYDFREKLQSAGFATFKSGVLAEKDFTENTNSEPSKKRSIVRQRAIYQLVLLDGFVAVLAWLLFFAYRIEHLGKASFLGSWQIVGLRNWFLGLIIIPAFWYSVYLLSGTYFDLYRKSRLHEFNRTVISCVIGTIVVALVAFANDVEDYTYFIPTTGWYILFHTFLTLVARIWLLTKVKQNLSDGLISFKTLIIGGNERAVAMYLDIQNKRSTLSNDFKGFVYSSHDPSNGMSKYLPQLGSFNNLEQIIDKYEIEEVIVAIESSEHHLLENILTQLSYRPMPILVLPDLYDIISGSVKISNVFNDAAFIYIKPELMPDWQLVCKRAFDIVASISAIIVFSPIFVLAAIKVRFSSRGPIFYKQQRVGLFGRHFNIYKFRSMYTDSEITGPRLSSSGDPRITAWGLTMRKYRIDEFPQFFNVLRGDMSLVGPRPERQHFINQISILHPHYKYLHKVRPGLTSWGMVKYGYAENISQMIERMKYDILYIENCSLSLDFKIIFFTIITVLKGSGK